MKCSTTLICIVLTSYVYAQSSVQSWAGNTVNVNVNCPVILIGDQCPAWVNPNNASGAPNNVLSTNTQILTSLGTDSLRSTAFNFGSSDPLIDNQALTGGRVNVFFEKNDLLVGLNLAGGAQIHVIYTNSGQPSLNRTFSLTASPLIDVTLLGIELKLLSAEATAGNVAGLTVGDVKGGNWQVNFRLSGLSISIETVLRVDAIQLEFDYEAPLFLDLIQQNYTIDRDILTLEWIVSKSNSTLHYHVEQYLDKSWTKISQVSSLNGLVTYVYPDFPVGNSLFRLCASDMVQTEKCFPPIAVHSTRNTDISIYPNPLISNSFINVSGTESLKRAEILSQDGRILDLPLECSNNACRIALTSVKQGLYVLRIFENDHKISHHKVLVLH